MVIGNQETEGALFFQWEVGDGFYTKRIEKVNKRKKAGEKEKIHNRAKFLRI